MDLRISTEKNYSKCKTLGVFLMRRGCSLCLYIPKRGVVKRGSGGSIKVAKGTGDVNEVLQVSVVGNQLHIF